MAKTAIKRHRVGVSLPQHLFARIERLAEMSGASYGSIISIFLAKALDMRDKLDRYEEAMLDARDIYVLDED